MSLARVGNGLTVLLLITCVVLGGVLAYELRAGLGPDTLKLAVAPARPDALGLDPPPTFTPPPSQAFSEVLERPLFTKGRQPPEQPDQTEQAAAGGPNLTTRFSLEGVAIAPPDQRIALVRNLSSKKLLRVGQGERLESWTVEAVRPDGVSLKYGTQTQELPLIMDRKPRGVLGRGGGTIRGPVTRRGPVIRRGPVTRRQPSLLRRSPAAVPPKAPSPKAGARLVR